MLGDLLDNRYRIIRTLSKGGFGQTYIAEDTRRPGCPRCVMKHLKPMVLDPGHLDNARRLFHTEAIALEKLGHHPQIPRLLAYFEENNDFYLVQDLVRGYPLTKELKSGFKWLEADIYQLLYDVLSILIFVHDRGVIHRDIKPDNIIRRQLDRTLVLVDFGSVKQIRTHLHPNHETGQTISIGTIGYMSMEQAHGRPRPNSDLYSLGIIGIQAATGIKPKHFQEDGETGELVWKHQASISDGLASFLEKMVAYHFKDRYLDARAALRDLKKLQPNEASRYELRSNESLLEKPSYWSLTASRLASAITSLRPGMQNTPLSQPTFIELPEPTEVSEVNSAQPVEEVPQTMPMAYVTPLVNPDADNTTADFDALAEDPDVEDSLAFVELNDRDEASSLPEARDIGPSAPLSTDELEGDRERQPSQSSVEGSLVSEMIDPAGSPEPSAVLLSSEPGTLAQGPAWQTLVNNVVTSHERWGVELPGVFTSSMLQRVQLLCSAFGSLGALVLIIFAGHLGVQRLQDVLQLRAILHSMQDSQMKGNYFACQKQAEGLESWPEELEALAHQCALQDAERLAELGHWEKAITSASAVPVDADVYYEEAQRLIRQWHIFVLEKAVAEGNMSKVNEAADAIPLDHPLQAQVQLTRLQILAEEQLWLESLELHEQGKWKEASQRIKPLESSAYFQERAKNLLREAELNLKQLLADEDAAQESSSISVSPSPSEPIVPVLPKKTKP